jgi:hypothetical protein
MTKKLLRFLFCKFSPNVPNPLVEELGAFLYNTHYYYLFDVYRHEYIGAKYGDTKTVVFFLDSVILEILKDGCRHLDRDNPNNTFDKCRRLLSQNPTTRVSGYINQRASVLN